MLDLIHLQNKNMFSLYRDRMRVPSLEAVYQTLAKQYQILMKEKENINKIKARIGMKDSAPAKIKYAYSKDNLYVQYHLILSNQKIETEKIEFYKKFLQECKLSNRFGSFVDNRRSNKK